MFFKRTLQTISFCTLLCLSSISFANKIVLNCPEQDYVLLGNENNYYFIKGIAKANRDTLSEDIEVQGRFLDPGFPASLKLHTLTTEAQPYDNRRGISFYCNLSNTQGVRVAFVRANFLLQDIGVKGLVAGCTSTGPETVCDITSAKD